MTALDVFAVCLILAGACLLAVWIRELGWPFRSFKKSELSDHINLAAELARLASAKCSKCDNSSVDGWELRCVRCCNALVVKAEEEQR